MTPQYICGRGCFLPHKTPPVIMGGFYTPKTPKGVWCPLHLGEHTTSSTLRVLFPPHTLSCVISPLNLWEKFPKPLEYSPQPDMEKAFGNPFLCGNAKPVFESQLERGPRRSDPQAQDPRGLTPGNSRHLTPIPTQSQFQPTPIPPLPQLQPNPNGRFNPSRNFQAKPSSGQLKKGPPFLNPLNRRDPTGAPGP